MPSCPFQVANQATPEQCVQLFEEATLKEACRVAGISFDTHALVAGYIAQVPQYMNGVLHHLSDNRCAAVTQALQLMFTAVNPVVNTWGFWSSHNGKCRQAAITWHFSHKSLECRGPTAPSAGGPIHMPEVPTQPTAPARAANLTHSSQSSHLRATNPMLTDVHTASPWVS